MLFRSRGLSKYYLGKKAAGSTMLRQDTNSQRCAHIVPLRLNPSTVSKSSLATKVGQDQGISFRLLWRVGLPSQGIGPTKFLDLGRQTKLCIEKAFQVFTPPSEWPNLPSGAVMPRLEYRGRLLFFNLTGGHIYSLHNLRNHKAREIGTENQAFGQFKVHFYGFILILFHEIGRAHV